MKSTNHIDPPRRGPRANPVCYGVAEGLRTLFPPVGLIGDGRGRGEEDDSARGRGRAPRAPADGRAAS